MKKIILISYIFALCYLLSANCKAQVTQEWVARYNSTYNMNDVPVAIVVDKSGNSYVTGYSFVTGVQNTVATTVKYNPQGVSQWVRTYYDASQPENQTKGISVDTLGNIYIIGYSGNTNTQFFYAWTIKYNSNGDSLWLRKFYGSGIYASPYALITDKSRNVYVTGSEHDQIFTIKYNTQGDSLWTRNHFESGYSISQSNSIALDTLGNVYVGGVAHVVSFVRDFLVLKYNSNGVKQWSKTYGVYNQDEISHKIAVDRFSNVYITGTGYNPNTADPYDYITIKYNSTGVQQWVKMYNRSTDEAYDMVIDYSDNVVVTGSSSTPSTSYDFCTIKYTPAGDTQWVKIYAGPTNSYDQSYNVIVDSSNNVYVNGRTSTSTTSGATTIKYSSSGIQQWLIQYSGAAVGIYSPGSGIAINKTRNIFVIADNNQNGTGDDYITIKYDQLDAIKKISTEIPNKFKLTQNYPNPFNPSTKIKFDIPLSPLNERGVGGFITLKIYDLLGREIATLVNQQLQPGTYEVEFDGTNYPSGVYFYRLTAGNYTNTKKLVLLK